MTSFRNSVVLGCFFVSGFCGLVYQIVWVRLIGYVFGNSVFATATVLAAFMGGLAVGSFLGGKVADQREDRIRWYGILEIIIGVYCLVLPFMLDVATPLFSRVYQSHEGSSFGLIFLRAIISGGILLIPTSCMGATLPLLLRHFVQSQEDLGRTIGIVYAINTFGAVGGCTLTGFLLIPELGVSTTTFIAAAANILVGVTAILFLDNRHRRETAASGGSEEDRFTDTEARACLFAFGLSGFVAMIYEVALARAFSLLLGSSTYAFTLMVSAFILGIGLGSILLTKWVKQELDLVSWLAGTQAGIGLSSMLMLFLIGELPAKIVDAIAGHRDSWSELQAIEFGYLFMTMIVPTALMGLMFPLTTAICTPKVEKIGASSGFVYFVNTLGAILGSLCGGFLFLPLFGIQQSIEMAAILNFGAAAIVILSHQKFGVGLKRGLAAVFIVTGFMLNAAIPMWDLDTFTSGPYLYAALRKGAQEQAQDSIRGQLLKQGEILWNKDGTACTVTVKRPAPGVLSISVNGKVDATSVGDRKTQRFIGHLPMFLHPGAEETCIIGLGSGMTLAAVLRHDPERADCVEISEDVAFAAKKFFGEFNDECLDDKRAELIIGDGRNHIALSARSYDVIICQPPNPWLAGIGSLFTVEFWKQCKVRLKPGGVMCQWLQTYHTTNESMQIVLRSFQEVFPHVTLWYSHVGDLILIGSEEPVSTSLDDLETKFQKPLVLEDMKSIGLGSPALFCAQFLTDSNGIKSLAGTGVLHTDDNSRLEFDMPRQMLRSSVDQYHALENSLTSPKTLFPQAEGYGRIQKANWFLNLAHGMLKNAQDPGTGALAVELLERSRRLSKEPGLLFRSFRILHTHFLGSASVGQLQRLPALVSFLNALLADLKSAPDEDFQTHLGVSQKELRSDLAKAVVAILKLHDSPLLRGSAIELCGESARLSGGKSDLLLLGGLLDGSATNESQAFHMGRAFAYLKKNGEALAEFKKSIEKQARPADSWLRMGDIHRSESRTKEAEQCYAKALEINSQHSEARKRLDLLRSRD
ncbi:MAG: fused MFS/spermidine synthase [Planctomycetota bacterium]|jgi:spermidine synthase|nr:fused MFS/spermidine synthase [Planctomycetota bacterium]